MKIVLILIPEPGQDDKWTIAGKINLPVLLKELPSSLTYLISLLNSSEAGTEIKINTLILHLDFIPAGKAKAAKN